jgi:peroxiredoxin
MNLGNLNDKLKQMSEKVAKKLPEEFLAVSENEVKKLADSNAIQGLSIGEKAPSFTLPDATGKNVSLSTSLKEGPVVLSFYRGSWWPYCQIELRELHGILPDIKNLSGSVIAISPEKPDNTLTMLEKLELPFPVLTDVNGDVMREYKVAWKLPEEIKENYIKHMKRDYTIINSGAGWELPIPATFIINQNGEIVFKYVNADYTKRLEPSEVLKVLKSL